MNPLRATALFCARGVIAASLLPTDLLLAQSGTVRVGFPIVTSGAGAQFGVPVLKGAQMFAEEANAAGGVLGRKFEIVPRDSKNRPDEAVILL